MEAQRHLTKSTELDKQSEYFAVLANMYMSLGRFDECERLVDKGLAYQPTSSSLTVQRARLHQEAGRVEAAVSTFRAALQLDPKSFDAKVGMAGALIKAGRVEELEAHLMRFGREEENTVAKAEFSRLLVQLLIRRFEDTSDADYLERAHSELRLLGAPGPKDRFLRGIIYAKAGRVAEALEDFEGSFKADGSLLTSKIYADKLRLHIRREKRGVRGADAKSWVIAIVVMLLTALAWYMAYIKILSPANLIVLTPIFLVFLVVAFVLPYLNKLTLTGMEVQLESASERAGMQVPLDALGIGRELRASLPQ
jgi:tetratricopeptide (TPR) repeat protein